MLWRDAVWKLAAALTVLLPWLLPTKALADIALSTIAALFLVHSFTVRDALWCKEGWVRIATALWMCMMARALFAPHMHEALARALPFVRYFVFAAALACWTLQNARVRRYFMVSLCAAALLWAADGLLQRFAGMDILRHPLLHDPAAGHVRLNGIFVRPILGIMLAWLCFPACMYMLQARTAFAVTRHFTLFAGLAFLVLFLAIALSGERMALLLCLLGMGLLVFVLPFRRRHTACALVVCVAIVGLLALFSPMFFNREFFSTFETFLHWRQSPYGELLSSDMRLAALHPLLGIGPNQFRFTCPELYASDPARITAMCNLHPHNIYMEWLIEEGAIGIALFVAFLIAVSRKAYDGWKMQRHSWVLAGFGVAFLLRIWPLASTTSFFSSWGAPPFWLILGGLLAYAQSNIKDTPC